MLQVIKLSSIRSAGMEMPHALSISDLEAAAKEFPGADVVKSSEQTTKDRFVVTKNRRSQANSNVGNVLCFEDNSVTRPNKDNKEVPLKYTISVNIMSNYDGHEADLLKLQFAVDEFLSNIHEKL